MADLSCNQPKPERANSSPPFLAEPLRSMAVSSKLSSGLLVWKKVLKVGNLVGLTDIAK
jgi:hypothetical protein